MKTNVFFVGLFIWGLFGCVPVENDSTKTPEYIENFKFEAKEGIWGTYSDLSSEVPESVNITGYPYYFYIKNIDGITVESPIAVLYFYDKSGNEIAGEEARPLNRILAPGSYGEYVSYFEQKLDWNSFGVVLVMVRPFQKASECQNGLLSYYVSNDFMVTDIEIVPSESFPEYNITIKGVISNVGESTSQSTQVSIFIISPDGSVLGNHTSYIDGSLPAGGESPFECLYPKKLINEYETVKLEVNVEGTFECPSEEE